jgi:hypothetical protein
MGIPIQDRHRVAGSYSQGSEASSQPVNAMVKIAVGVPHLVAIHDLLIRSIVDGGIEKLLD